MYYVVVSIDGQFWRHNLRKVGELSESNYEILVTTIEGTRKWQADGINFNLCSYNLEKLIRKEFMFLETLNFMMVEDLFNSSQ